MKTNFDKRTGKYFASIKKSIGLLGENGGEGESLKEILKKKGVKDIFPKVIWEESIGVFGIGTCILLKYSTEYCAEVWVPYGGDGLYTHTYLFDKKPSKKDIETAHLMSTIQVEMDLRNQSPTEKCGECGNAFHWLDGGVSLQEKWYNLQEKYCGC